MKVDSPYGKDVKRELTEVYKVDSIGDLQKQITDHLFEEYGLRVHRFDHLTIAYCMCLRLITDLGPLYLKFTATDINSTPTEMLHLVTFLRNSGLPLPEILSAKNGEKHLSLLKNTNYSITFLMKAVNGKPVSGQNLQQVANYAKVMADFHRFGDRFSEESSRVMGGKAARTSVFEIIQSELPEIQTELERYYKDLFTPDEQRILNGAFCHLERKQKAISEIIFKKTHIHGDFRLCHVFEVDDQISGIVDFDESCFAERVIDICFGMISAPKQNDGKVLNVEQQRIFLETYHQHYPLTGDEVDVLADLLIWSNLEQLLDLCSYLKNNVEAVTEEKLSSNVEEILLLMENPFFNLT